MLKSIEAQLKDRIGTPAEICIHGSPKPVWGFIVDADGETLHLDSGGGRYTFFVRVSDISAIRVEGPGE